MWETYRYGNTVRLRRSEKRAQAKDKAKRDLAALKKADLVALAEERGEDASGTKAELVERLDE